MHDNLKLFGSCMAQEPVALENMTVLTSVADLLLVFAHATSSYLICMARVHGKVTCSASMPRDGESRERGVRAVATVVSVARDDQSLLACNKI